MSAHTVWKFEFAIDDAVEIEMPEHAKILAAQTQNGVSLCLWAIVDSAAPRETRRFRIFGTGHALSHDEEVALSYIGTVQTHGGRLVWHVFEERPAIYAMLEAMRP